MSEQKIIKEKQIKDSYTEVTQRRKKKNISDKFFKTTHIYNELHLTEHNTNQKQQQHT
jgi:hypothetical protein